MVRANILIGEEAVEIELGERTFKTGSTGFYGTSKVGKDGNRYQINVMAVKIGSKPLKDQLMSKIARAKAKLDEMTQAYDEAVKA